MILSIWKYLNILVIYSKNPDFCSQISFSDKMYGNIILNLSSFFLNYAHLITYFCCKTIYGKLFN